MTERFYILGGDERQTWAALRLQERGAETLTHGVPGLPDHPLPPRFTEQDRVVLPFPAFQGQALRGKAALPAETVLTRLGLGTQVFGGLLGHWRERMEAQGAAATDLYGTEPLTTQNAAATAEGAIGLALARTPFALQGASCLVIGFGRIGKLLAQRLHALSAQVTVAARKDADRALAESLGLCSTQTGCYPEGLGRYRVIFNTVPAPVLSEAQLKTVHPHCLLMELASAPGGIPAEHCGTPGLNYLAAPGLPGQWAPATMGACYADSILNLR